MSMILYPLDPSVNPMSNDDEAPQCSRVLGVVWNSERDVVKFIPVLNFSPKRKGVYTKVDLTVADVPQSIPLQLTRRMVLEQTMKLFDPFGFLSPFSLLAKSLLRETWVGKLGWDDPLSEQLRNKWVAFFVQLFQVANLEFDRCLKPAHAVGLPSLVILSDGSDLADDNVQGTYSSCQQSVYSPNGAQWSCDIQEDPIHHREGMSF